MPGWTSSYLVAGLRLEIASSVGDPSAYLPGAMREFSVPAGDEPDLAIIFHADERAQADALKRFFPPQFAMGECDEGLSFNGREGKRKRLGFIPEERGAAEMGLPLLDLPWRIPEEEEAVREAIQAFVKACLQYRLLQRGGTLMHAAGVVWEGKGFVFTGHTRAGKTTLSRGFPAREVLGDDLVAVVPGRGGFRLFGTPWPGREGGTVSYGDMPLRAVFHLHPELETGLYHQSPAEALAEMAVNAPRLGYAGEESKLLGVFSSLVETIPICIVSVKLGDDVMPYLRRITEGEKG